ncbi:MAG: menaquinone reductase multiheme cytochrome c subunit QrcA [Bacteroidota bacterium]
MIQKGALWFLSGFGLALLIGWYAFPQLLYRSVDQPVQFSHAVHAGEAVGMTCDGCHTVSDDGRFAGIPTLEQCAGCHADVVGATEAEKHFVEEYVRQGREVPWLVYARQPDNAHFSHADHVKVGEIACERCHGPHGTTETLRPFEENRITGYSRDVWGANISGVKSNPWEGMKMDDCVACHKENNRRSACLACHK